MEIVEMTEAVKLVQSIRDHTNPQAASEALRLRDKWLFENEIGALRMEPDVRYLLENALISIP